MGAIASACSFGGEDSSVDSSSSSKAEISSSTSDESSSEESSSTPDESSSEESSSTPDESSSEESSSTPDESSSEESSSTPDESSVEESSSTPDESSSEESSSKPDEDSSKEDSSSDSSSESSSDTTQYYTFYAKPLRCVRGNPTGGWIVNAVGDTINFDSTQLAEGSSYTATAVRASNEYYFLGWYYAEELEDLTEENFISSEETYTFTIDKNINVCAVFAYKEDPIKLTVEDSSISYKNGEPTLTLVKKGDTTFTDPRDIRVYGVFPTGEKEDYGVAQYTSYFKMNDGGFDINTVGTYTITYSYQYNENIKVALVVQVVEEGIRSAFRRPTKDV